MMVSCRKYLFIPIFPTWRWSPLELFCWLRHGMVANHTW